MQLQIPTPADVRGKTVLARVDFNVPIETGADGKDEIVDDRRLRNALETIQFLQQNQAKTVLIAHRGRPGGQVDPELSLAPVAEYFSKNLGVAMQFCSETVGETANSAVAALAPGDVLLLENVRFQPEEKKNNPNFVAALANLADVYINEAFSVSHRAHASTFGVAEKLPHFAGFALKKEVEMLTQLLENPTRPFYIVIGGAKISDKVGILQKLADVADAVLVGGGVANVFLKADGIETHHSYLEDAPVGQNQEKLNYVQIADELIEEHKTEKVLKDGYIPLPKIIYPVDVVAAPSMETTNPDELQVIDLSHDAADTPNDLDLMYLDIGPKTQQLYAELLTQAGSVFWNGPMGVIENELFAGGTEQVAQAMAAHTADGSQTLSVVGGGDTVAAVDELGLAEQFTFVSTAGGAGMSFLAGEELPGLEILRSKKS